MKEPDITKLVTNQWNDKHIKIHYPEYYEMIYEKYPFIQNISEGIYLYVHNMDKPPVCNNCGKPVKFVTYQKGYTLYCCKKCSRCEKTTQKIQQTNLERYGHVCNLHIPEVRKKVIEGWIEKYGTDNPAKSNEIKEKTQQTCLERYGVKSYQETDEFKEKSKQTCLERYGVEKYQKTQEFSKHMKKIHGEINEKVKKTCLERYGVESYTKTDEWKQYLHDTKDQRLEKRKQTMLKHFGNEHYVRSDAFKEALPSIQQKKHETYQKNNSFNKSGIEEQFAKWLRENNIEYKTQYRSEKYPFHCDFYFPDNDLYFEINGHWTHGRHRFNPNDINDKKTLELWKSKNTEFFKIAIKVWTDLDIRKYKCAEENNLNYIVVYSNNLEQVIDAYKKGVAN